MVIALSGVQFCLKSHAGFQNRMSKLLEFDLKSQVWFQNKIINLIMLSLNNKLNNNIFLSFDIWIQNFTLTLGYLNPLLNNLTQTLSILRGLMVFFIFHISRLENVREYASSEWHFFGTFSTALACSQTVYLLFRVCTQEWKPQDFSYCCHKRKVQNEKKDVL